MADIPKGHLYLGEVVDPVTHDRTGQSVTLEAAKLTTHGVIVGMTGSGKTGLAVVLIEEALLQGIPVIVLDPKGDMGNLALRFPDLDPASFRPWINEADAERDAVSPDQHATAVAESWRSGLESWGIGADRVRELASSSTVTVYTPGSTAGVPINLVGNLKAATGGPAEAEAAADEIEGYVSGLLGLVGIDADPLVSREHILLSNLIHHAWTNGVTTDLASLVAQVQDPPLRKLGVLELESFYPKADRVELALKLNGLLASPSFAAWALGEPLDIARWLDPDGGPRASIVTLSHLSDEERQFVTTLVLSKIVTWFRSQPGTPELRALVYMDEVFGFVPPTASPPSKMPILTIMKQARAFGVGMVLATQNPVDVDYKAIANAGTWMIGRLQTERDKARLLEGMQSAGGGVDLAHLDATISGLAKREFVLHQTSAPQPVVFGTRWAMSYLAGPMTREQIERLGQDRPSPTEAPAGEPADRTLGADETSVVPGSAAGVEVSFVDPAAPWLAALGASSVGVRLRAGVAVRVHLTFDDTAADLRHTETYEAVGLLSQGLDPATLVPVDYDDRDFRSDAPPGAVFALPDSPVQTKAFFVGAQKTVVDHLLRERTLTLFRNAELKLVSRLDESPEQFDARCQLAGDAGADADAAQLRSSLEKRIDRVRDAIAKAEDRAREVASDAEARRSSEMLSRAGDLLGGLLGGRRGTRSILGGFRRAASDRRQSANAAERLESAQHRIAEKVDELEELEQELRAALADIRDDWDAKASATVEFGVELERSDIDVEELRLLWIPAD